MMGEKLILLFSIPATSMGVVLATTMLRSEVRLPKFLYRKKETHAIATMIMVAYIMYRFLTLSPFSLHFYTFKAPMISLTDLKP